MIRWLPASFWTFQKSVVCPSSPRTTWWPFDRCGSSSRVAFCAGVVPSTLPPIRSVGVFESGTRSVGVVVGVRRPRVDEPAAGPDELVAGVAEHGAAAARGGEVPLGHADVGAPDGRDVAPDLGAREEQVGHQRHRPHAARVAVIGGAVGVERERRRQRTGAALEHPEERRGANVAALDRQEAPVIGQVRARPPHRRRDVAVARAAVLIARAQRGVPIDLLVALRRLPEEVAGRVDGDHHRPVDAGRVAPRVDHRGARSGALADEVDAAVVHRSPGRLEVVDALRQRVAGQVDALARQPVRAVAEGGRAGAERLVAEQVRRTPQRRRHLGTVEHRRAVDAAVADEDDVVVLVEPARGGEVDVAAPGSALEAEDRRARVSGARRDPRDGQRDQPRARIVAVLGDHERPAVGGDAALLGLVVARLEGQLAGVRAGRDGHLIGAAGEVEVAEAGGQRSYQDEGADLCTRYVAKAHVATLRALPRGGVVARSRRASHAATRSSSYFGRRRGPMQSVTFALVRRLWSSARRYGGDLHDRLRGARGRRPGDRRQRQQERSDDRAGPRRDRAGPDHRAVVGASPAPVRRPGGGLAPRGRVLVRRRPARRLLDRRVRSGPGGRVPARRHPQRARGAHRPRHHRRLRGDRHVQRPDPHARRRRRAADRLRARLARRPDASAAARSRRRRRSSARNSPSASARPRRGSPSPRSARGSPASCTTSSRTRSA